MLVIRDCSSIELIMLTGRLGRWLSGQGIWCPNLMTHVQTPEPMERWEAGPRVCVPSVPKGLGGRWEVETRYSPEACKSNQCCGKKRLVSREVKGENGEPKLSPDVHGHSHEVSYKKYTHKTHTQGHAHTHMNSNDKNKLIYNIYYLIHHKL